MVLDKINQYISGFKRRRSLRQGLELGRVGKTKEAIRLLGKAMSGGETDAEILNARAWFLVSLGRNEELLSICPGR